MPSGVVHRIRFDVLATVDPKASSNLMEELFGVEFLAMQKSDQHPGGNQ